VTGAETGLARIGLSADGTHFVSVKSGERFVAWGFNYDHDDSGRLLEDYWVEGWPASSEANTSSSGSRSILPGVQEKR